MFYAIVIDLLDAIAYLEGEEFPKVPTYLELNDRMKPVRVSFNVDKKEMTIYTKKGEEKKSYDKIKEYVNYMNIGKGGQK